MSTCESEGASNYSEAKSVQSELESDSKTSECNSSAESQSDDGGAKSEGSDSDEDEDEDEKTESVHQPSNLSNSDEDDDDDSENDSNSKRRELSPFNAEPQQLLHRAQRKARLFIKNGEKDEAVNEYIKCVALARIVYGEGHWCLAQAHVLLASSYLDLKGYSEQASEHGEMAKSIILSWHQPPKSHKKRAKFLYVLLNVYLVLGRSQTILLKYAMAQKYLEKANNLVEVYVEAIDDCKQGKMMKCKTLTALAKLNYAMQQFSSASSIYKEVLELLQSVHGNESSLLIPVHQGLGQALQKSGKKFFPEALLQFNTALEVAEKVFGDENDETMKAELLLVKSVMAMKGISKSKCEKHLIHILETMAVEPNKFSDSTIDLEAADLLASIFISTDRQEEAKILLQSKLTKKCRIYGEASYQTITTYQLLGSLCLAMDDHNTAAKYLRRCYDREVILFGCNHSRAKSTKFSLDRVCQNPEVNKRYRIPSPSLANENRPKFIVS